MVRISGTDLAKKYKGYYQVCMDNTGLEHFFDGNTLIKFTEIQGSILKGLFNATTGIKYVKKILDRSLDLVTAKDKQSLNKIEEDLARELLNIFEIIDKYMYALKPDDAKKLIPNIQGEKFFISKLTMKEIEIAAVYTKSKDNDYEFVVNMYKPIVKVIDFSAKPKINKSDILKLIKKFKDLEESVTKYLPEASDELKTTEGLLEVTIDKLKKGLDTIISDYKSRADDSNIKAFRRAQIASIKRAINIISTITGKLYLKTLLNIGVMGNDIVNSGIVEIVEKTLKVKEK